MLIELSTVEAKLENFRNQLEEFIKKSDVPTKSEERRKREILIVEAFKYICEIDLVKNKLDEICDNYWINNNADEISLNITTHKQVETLMNKHHHTSYYCGNFAKVVDIIVNRKHHFFVALSPISLF